MRRFKYRQDAKATLVGRLLMRFWAVKMFQKSNEDIIFNRTEKGRPRILLEHANVWDFNVSHAGNYTVFVAQGKLLHSGKNAQLSRITKIIFVIFRARKFNFCDLIVIGSWNLQ